MVTTDVTLPIRDLKNANPAWLRSSENLRPLDPLIRSLTTKGMLLPVLVRPDFVVLDGARRILAAEKMGWSEVPIIVANSWLDVRRYYNQLLTVEQEVPGVFNKPLNWQELDELWSKLFKPVHQSHKMQQALSERKRRAKLRQRGYTEPEIHHHDSDNAYTGYVTDLASFFQCRPIHVKLIRDIFHVARELSKTTPGFREVFDKLLKRAEDLGFQTTSTMRQFTRNVREGMAIEKATERAERSLNNSFKAPWRKAVRSEDIMGPTTPAAPAVTHAVITKDVVQNLVKLLEQLSLEAGRFYEFEQKVDLDIVLEAADTIRVSVNRINAMRRRLEAHGETLRGERRK